MTRKPGAPAQPTVPILRQNAPHSRVYFGLLALLAVSVGVWQVNAVIDLTLERHRYLAAGVELSALTSPPADLTYGQVVNSIDRCALLGKVQKVAWKRALALKRFGYVLGNHNVNEANLLARDPWVRNHIPSFRLGPGGAQFSTLLQYGWNGQGAVPDGSDLDYCASTGDVVTIRALLHHGCNPNGVVLRGRIDRPLITAVHFGRANAVHALLQAGARPELTTSDGESVQTAAIKYHHTEMLQLVKLNTTYRHSDNAR